MGNTLPATPVAAISRRFEPALPVDQIARNPRNHRKTFDPVALGELAESIARDGLLQPIVVVAGTCRDPDDDPAGIPARAYQLLMGERRLRAARLAGLATLPAMVFSEVSAERALALALVENLQRESLNAMEEAEGFGDLAALGYTQQEIAAEVHKSRARVSNAMRLLELPDGVKEHVRAGTLTQKHAEGLLRFRKFPRLLVAIADLAVRRGAAAAELAKGIPFVSDLVRTKAIKELGYEDLEPAGLDIDDSKVFAELKKLEFIQVVKADNPHADDEIFALDVEAFDAWLQERIQAYEEKRRKQAEEQARELEKSRKKAAADAPGEPQPEAPAEAKPHKIVDLEKLDRGSYKILVALPVGIRRQIPAEAIEIGAAPRFAFIDGVEEGQAVEFTRDIALVNRLERQKSVTENRAVREKLDVAFECALKAVKGIKAITTDDLAQIAEWACPSGFGAHDSLDAAFADLGIEPTDEIHRLKPLQIVQLIIMRQLRQQYNYQRKNALEATDDIECYAGDYQKVYKKRKEAEKKAAAAAKKDAVEDARTATNLGIQGKAKRSAAKAPKPKKGRRVEMTDELRGLILDAIKEGGTGATIAKKFGVSLPTVQNIKREAGLTRTSDKAAAAK